MFNLIITIIAIALVVVLTATSIYYGGDAFNKGSEDALAATFVNQAQQVQAAATLYKAQNGSDATAMTQLEGEFLATVPQVKVGETQVPWSIDGEYGYVSGALGDTAAQSLTRGVCDAINSKGSGIVKCYSAATAVEATDLVANVTGAPDAGAKTLALQALNDAEGSDNGNFFVVAVQQ